MVLRCSNVDLVMDYSTGKMKLAQFSLGSRWDRNALTWRVTKFPRNDLGEDKVLDTMRRAFSIWERSANLTFSEASQGVGDLEIRFESGDHGDGDAFDREGGTLAHAFFPRQGKISGESNRGQDRTGVRIE